MSTPELPPDWQNWPPGAKAELLWRLKARTKQMPPEGDWDVWLILSGRGWGKTVVGAQWILSKVRRMPNTRWAIIAPTFGAGVSTCVEGETGILAYAPEIDRNRNWNRSLGELKFPNGAFVKVYGAESADRLRGPQHHGVWIDELAVCDLEAWNQMRFGLRLGEHPQIVVTTTPQPTDLIKDLHEAATKPTESLVRAPGSPRSHALGLRVALTVGHTRENAENLPAATLSGLENEFEGTRRGRQELAGEILEDVEGALWTSEMIDGLRDARKPDDVLRRLSRIVVAVDPAVTTGEDADETGIIVAGVEDRPGGRAHAYVLADLSGKFSPEVWTKRVVAAYETWEADRIIGETNNGGDLIESLLRNADQSVPYRSVHASHGKRVRAEPIAALYEQQRVHHVGRFDKLEDQMTRWVPDKQAILHDDRLDALVWAIWELMIVKRPAFLGAA